MRENQVNYGKCQIFTKNMFGLTPSTHIYPGPIGHQGKPGPFGIQPEKNPITIFCKKDYGFIKSGQYVNVFFNEHLNADRVPFFSFHSKDDKMSIYLDEKEVDEYFIWKSNDLRHHKLGSIGM